LITVIIAASIIGIGLFPDRAFSILAKAKESIKIPEFAKVNDPNEMEKGADAKKTKAQTPVATVKVVPDNLKSRSVRIEKQKIAPVSIQRWYRGTAVSPDPNIDSNIRHALPLNSTWLKSAQSESLPKMTDGELGYLRWGNKRLNLRGAVAVYHPQDHLLDITLFEDSVTAATLTKHLELSSKETLPNSAPMRLQLKFSSGALHASNSTLIRHRVSYHPGLVNLLANGQNLPQIGDLKISGVLDGDGASIAFACLSKKHAKIEFTLALAVPVSFAPDIIAYASTQTFHH
jgi:hypothetical protein